LLATAVVEIQAGSKQQRLDSQARVAARPGRPLNILEQVSMKNLIVSLIFLVICGSCAPRDPEVARWEQRAENVTIIRDDWGIPHIYGRTDADAVFGMVYAQAEDDFNRVELNYINGMGRLAEAEGEAELYRDLRMKLFIDPERMRQLYDESPEWLQRLMDAWADGLNYYLYNNPQVTPRVITRFEPWMALTFTEGSIGGDIESVSLSQLEDFYGDRFEDSMVVAETDSFKEPRGSNGMAVAPSNTASGNALFLINPHTSFYFRAELQVASDEGLNAYGAVTWGQFFVYQGFNDRLGWMHTSTNSDCIDEYLETVVENEDGFYYRYGDGERPFTATNLTLPYRTEDGMANKELTVYHSHHGPIVREVDGKWVAVKLMQEPIKALTQSYLRTKATNYQSFYETMELNTNSSNNTVYADADGNIAYFHGNFIPKRDPRFDWNNPVDGSNPATEWQGLHTVEEIPHLVNPQNGWIQNTNNWPYSAAGPNSPRKQDFPSYMSTSDENARGLHAIRVLQGKTDFTLETLRDAAYDSYLTGFEDLIPALIRSYDRTPDSNPLKARLTEQMEVLRNWDLRFSVESVPTALAMFWGQELMGLVGADARRARVSVYDYMATRATAAQRLQALAAATDKLESDFGSWRIPWGEINRFQRLTDDVEQRFDDDAPSIPVGFASGRWGSLASFGASPRNGSKKWYGTSGNSFVAVVEFGDSVRAMAITAGGQSGDLASPHFNDQALRYSTGDLRPVYFYRGDLEGHITREYHPGKSG
jgi:acyl-homoserine-lactone acylase